ncbi:MAG: aldolase [Armatimonadetes bacterium]|nr:aldolase [Armatimonadota bacterium]
MLELMLFTNDLDLACQAEKAGIDRIVIDLENRGKEERQHGYHLECNCHSLDDLKKMRQKVKIPILCRINAFNDNTKKEIKDVLNLGADIIMLPMFKRTEEVKNFISLVNKKAKTCLLLEDKEAFQIAPQIAEMDFDEIYIGLNDLAISFKKKFCYEFLLNGKLDYLRKIFKDKKFGFGGITVIDKGKPLPARLILKEMARLNSDMAILRRAFKRDIKGRFLKEEVSKIKELSERYLKRSNDDVLKDKKEVQDEIRNILKI